MITSYIHVQVMCYSVSCVLVYVYIHSHIYITILSVSSAHRKIQIVLLCLCVIHEYIWCGLELLLGAQPPSEGGGAWRAIFDDVIAYSSLDPSRMRA